MAEHEPTSADHDLVGQALRTAARTSLPDFTELDQTIESRIEQHFRAVRSGRRIRRLGYGLATAAAILIAVVSIWVVNQPGGTARTDLTGRAVLVGDVDGSGHVDILDAFAVARTVDSGAAPDPETLQLADVNEDGALSGADVDAIAGLAVRLPADEEAQGS